MNESLPLLCDVIFCLVIIISVIRGCKAGFAGMLVQLLSGILAMLAAYFVMPYAVQILDKIGLTAKISAKIAETLKFDSLIPEGLISAGQGSEIIQHLPLPEVLKNQLILSDSAEAYETLGVSTFGEYLSVSLAQIILRGISLLLLFILFSWLFSWLGSKLKFVNKVPLVGMINSVLGGAAGLVIALIILYLIISIITTAAPAIKPLAQINQAMEKSTIVSWMIQHNLGLDLLLDLFRK